MTTLQTKHTLYTAYRPSGVEWLGEIPAHWEVMQLGRIGRFSKGIGGTKQDEISEGVPCIRYGDLYTSHRNHIETSRSCVALTRAAEYTPIQYGDILFAGSGETIEEIGKAAVNLIEPPVCCGGDVILFRPDIEMDARFSGYAIDCPPVQYQKSSMGRGITVMHIYGDELKNLWVPLPPLAEQRAIATFLDDETAKIDALISKKERLIELLQEKRTALISQAVTWGLDPDTPVKDSAIDGLGEIPAHWEVTALRRLIAQVAHPLTVDPEQVYREIGIRSWGKGIFHKEPVQGVYLGEKRVFNIRPGELVLNIVFAWEGAVAVTSEDDRGMIASHRFPTFQHLSTLVDLDYLLMILQSEHGRALMALNSPGAAGRNRTIRIDAFLDENVPLPPLKEQKEIVATFRSSEERLQSLSARVQEAIECLKELRMALISAAVTGRIDVREEVSHP